MRRIRLRPWAWIPACFQLNFFVLVHFPDQPPQVVVILGSPTIGRQLTLADGRSWLIEDATIRTGKLGEKSFSAEAWVTCS
jgi:hypothetical protein